MLFERDEIVMGNDTIVAAKRSGASFDRNGHDSPDHLAYSARPRYCGVP
jgi:hypothetical protein